MTKGLEFKPKKRNVGKDYGLIPARGREGTPMVLDDRLISKQYLKAQIDKRIVNDPYDATEWNDDTENTASRDSIYELVGTWSQVTDVWAKQTTDADSNVRTAKTGNYAIGEGNFSGISNWEKLYVSGNIKTTGNYIMQNNGSTIGPSSGELTLHSSNGAKLATKFAIGATNPTIPFIVQVAGNAVSANDNTGIAQFGAAGGANLGLDANDIQARAGGTTAADFYLNRGGGNIYLGKADDSTTYIQGDLIVQGAATTLNTDELHVEDNVVVLNSNVSGTTGQTNAGIDIERGDWANVGLRWNESTNVWEIQSATDNATPGAWSIIGSGAPVTLGTNTASALTLSGQEIGLADKFVQIAGDTMTAPLTIGSASSGAVTNLTVWGDDATDTTVAALRVEGLITAAIKSFNIEHPLKKGMRLVHGSLEGPEFGMYQRGTLKSSLLVEEIPLPEYWKVMVGDYTVNLTPHGNYHVWIVEKNKTMFKIKTSADAIDGPWKCDWMAVGCRLDHKLEVELNASE